MILIVAGVAGSGKTTVGALLAGRLRWRFADADTFHPEANIAKMRAGIPLTDEDREPWLRAVSDWMDATIADGQSGGDHLLGAQARLPGRAARRAAGATMVFLLVSREVLDRRLTGAAGPFLPREAAGQPAGGLRAARRRTSGVQTVLAEGDARADRREDHRPRLWPRRRRPACLTGA